MRFKKLLIGFTGALVCCVSYATTGAATMMPMTMSATSNQSFNVATTVVNTGGGRPQIGIDLGAPAQVKLLQGSTVLAAASLPAGVSYISTASFPAGNYPVTVQVTENNMTFNVLQNVTINP